MAFAPPSLQKDYTLCSSLDPALDLPDLVELPDNASAEDVATAKAITADRAQKLKVAAATGNWSAITKPGERPTEFSFRQIFGSALTWLSGQVERNRLSGDESFELAFRLALKDISNFGKVDLQREKLDGHLLVTQKSLESIYAIGRDTAAAHLGRLIVLELGMLVFSRAIRGVDPL